MNWTPATPISRDTPFSSRTIPLSPFFATHTQSPLCDAKCASATSFLSDSSALFHFPYPVSPVFATHTKTAGCVPTIPILELSDPRSFLSCTYELLISQALCFDIHASDGGCGGYRRSLPLFTGHWSQVTDHDATIPGGFLRRSEMSRQIRTWMVLTLAGVALVCGQGAVAQQKEPDWSKVQIKVTKVSTLDQS